VGLSHLLSAEGLRALMKNRLGQEDLLVYVMNLDHLVCVVNHLKVYPNAVFYQPSDQPPILLTSVNAGLV
jgi:hypothetical protein